MKKLYAGIVLNKDELTESNSNRIELEYYKISRKNKDKAAKKSNLYGIEIVKKEYLGNKKLKERNNIYNVTNDEDVINRLLSTLKSNQVTPIALEEIMDEVL